MQLASLLSLPQNVRAATAVGSLPAPTTSLPTAVMILSDEGHRHRQLGAEPDPDGILPLLDAPAPAASTTGITMDQVPAEIAKAIPPVRENLIVPRRRVAHAIGVPEAQNEVHCWRTTCTRIRLEQLLSSRQTVWARSCADAGAAFQKRAGTCVYSLLFVLLNHRIITASGSSHAQSIGARLNFSEQHCSIMLYML